MSHKKNTNSVTRRRANFILALTALFFASAPALSQDGSQSSIILHVSYMGELDENGNATGQVDVQVHNASAVTMERVQIEPPESNRSLGNHSPAQIPTLSANETAVVFSSVQSLSTSEEMESLWTVVYYTGDVKHEEQTAGIFFINAD